MLRIVSNALDQYQINRTIQQLNYYRPICDVYDNPFESKLQLPKQYHKEFPFCLILDQLLCSTTMALMEAMLDLPIMREIDEYHNAFFIYRQGDFLQNHLDTAIHDNKRKVITANLYLTEGQFIYQDAQYSHDPGTLIAFVNDDNSYHGVSPTEKERMLVSVGYIGPNSINSNRGNKRALFQPWLYEAWNDAKWQLAKERSE